MRSLLAKARRFPVWLGYRKGPLVMSRIRRAWVVFRNPHADIQIHPTAYLGPGFSLHMPHGGTFIAGPGVEFRRNFRAELGPHGRISIGAGSYCTYGTVIACSTSIDIGERCGLGLCVQVYDGNHRYRDLDKTFLEQGYDFRPITIEDDAQIHGLCTIVNSVGHRSILGANSVVTRPIPPFCVAAGVPARVLDYYGPPGGEPEGWVPKEKRD